MRRLCEAVCVLLVLFVGAGAGAATGIRPGEERMVFVAKPADGEHYQVFSVRTDGTGRVQLTDGDFEHCDPHWSGGKIVFERGAPDEDGEYAWEIWTMDADGSNPRRVVYPSEGAKTFDPRISPQGDRVLYVRSRPGPDSLSDTRRSWHVITLADGKSVQLDLPGCARGDANWSADGRKIIYAAGLYRDKSGYHGDYRIGEYDIETGKNRTLLPTAKRSWRYSPRVSPDGRRVVFQQQPAGAEDHVREIRILDLASGKVSEPLVTSTKGYWCWGTNCYLGSLRPAWTLDGRWIYFSRLDDEEEPWCGRCSLWRVPADGSAEPSRVAHLNDLKNTGIASFAVVGDLPGEDAPLALRLDSAVVDDDSVLVCATVTGGTKPFRFEWRLADEADWADLAPDGEAAVVRFLLRSGCMVKVTVTDAKGRTATASLYVDPPDDAE
ncbi:MAG: hypothetical protein R6V58_18215 [Planctomycetota bacterium]